MKTSTMSTTPTIIVVPFPHTGHIFPATELCVRLAGHGYRTTILLPAPAAESPHPLITVVALPITTNSMPHHFGAVFSEAIQKLIASSRPLCAIVDDMQSSLIDQFADHGIPTVGLLTSSACSSAFQHAMSNIPKQDLSPGKKISVPDLNEEIVIPSVDFHHRPRPPPGRGPLGLPDHPNWVPPRDHDDHHNRPNGLPARSTIAALMNTCEELEKPYLDYVAKMAGKPVWGVGPLLADKFWASISGPDSAPVNDGDVRPKNKSNVTESEVMAWLDGKPKGSVIYVAFGTLVRPSEQELAELFEGLVESGRPFIWVVQPGGWRRPNGFSFSPREVPDNRALVIEGWAPQLLILSHAATGAYVCHCGWNSTVEALASGMRVLAWPVRGDQPHNARLMTVRLGVGITVKRSGGQVSRRDVVEAVDRLMEDEDIGKRAAKMRSVFARGYPKSSSASLDEFINFVLSRSCQRVAVEG